MGHLFKNMKKRGLFLIVSCVSFCILHACTYRKESDLIKPGKEICDTSSVSFSASIKPILDTHCTSCHREGGTGPGNFNDFTTFQSYVNSGQIRNRVIDQKTMPPSSNPDLSDCELTALDKWIKEGALNN